MKKNLIVLALTFTVAACSLEPKVRPRKFELNNVWTVPFSEKPLNKFRRLNRSSPVLLKLENRNLVIFGNPYNGVIAVDDKTGNQVWTYQFKHGTEAKISTEGHFIFIAANDGFVYALDGENGQLLWSYPTRSENIAELVVNRGLVYVLSSQNTLYGLEAASGKRVWIYTRPDSHLFSIRGGGRPAVIQDKLFVGFGDGSLVAFKAGNGQVLWEQEFSRNKRFQDLDSDILALDDSVIVGGFDEAVYRVNKDSGLIIWKAEGGMFGAFALLGDTLCYSQTEKKIRCLESESGKIRLDIPIQGGLATPPVFFKGLLVFGESEGGVKVWDIQDKKQISSFYSGRGLMAAPLVDIERERIYFVSNESYLYALEAKWKKSLY
jgi:outer membrane protein assembly factor BamB